MSDTVVIRSSISTNVSAYMAACCRPTAASSCSTNAHRAGSGPTINAIGKLMCAPNTVISSTVPLVSGIGAG
ncbi:unannotated protein [freshwater metagenome]|uniref:Unannotated protein n=1 Tax=freshwater metagenome TaxID=449393 RepID=A0A6J7FZ81_9ZZZZ